MTKIPRRVVDTGVCIAIIEEGEKGVPAITFLDLDSNGEANGYVLVGSADGMRDFAEALLNALAEYDEAKEGNI